MGEPGSSEFVWEEPVPESSTWVRELGTGSRTPPPGVGTVQHRSILFLLHLVTIYIVMMH